MRLRFVSRRGDRAREQPRGARRAGRARRRPRQSPSRARAPRRSRPRPLPVAEPRAADAEAPVAPVARGCPRAEEHRPRRRAEARPAPRRPPPPRFRRRWRATRGIDRRVGQTPPPPEVIRPPRLAPGDVVRVDRAVGARSRARRSTRASPSSPRRYDVRYDEELFTRTGYLAGSDERRLAELPAALEDPDARAIVMARGGYGLLRLLPFIDPRRFVAPPPADRRILRRDGAARDRGARRAGVDSRPGRHPARQPGRRPISAALFALLETPGPSVVLDGLEELIPGRVRGPLAGRQPRGLLAPGRHALSARPRAARSCSSRISASGPTGSTGC